MSYPKQPVHAGRREGNNNNHHNTNSLNINDNAAARTGAAKAFINGLPPQELVRYVNRHSPNPPPKPPKPSLSPSTGRRASSTSINSTASAPRQYVSHGRQSSFGGHDHLPVPASTGSNPPRNPSNIAAALAAARASPAVNKSAPDHHIRKAKSPAPALKSRTGSDSTTASNERLDETPIPTTTSLVKLFEQRESPANKSRSPSANPFKQWEEVPANRSRPPPIKLFDEGELPTVTPQTPPLIASKPAVLQSPKPLRRSQILDTAPTPLFPPANHHHQPLHAQVAAKELLKETGLSLATEDNDDSASLDSFTSAKEMLSPVKSSKPDLPLPRRRAKPATHSEPSKPGMQLHPPNRHMSSTAPIDIRRPSSSRTNSSIPSNSHPSIAAVYHQMHPRRMTPLTTGDSLANAIVASSLASSRAPSPHKAPPVPGPRHKAASVSHSFFTRTPSPQKKGMRQTLRRSSSAESDDEEIPFAKHKKKKKRFIRKHPNKHHEGDRKRWRDAVTERERKRYEGVWAANKGIHLFFTAEELDYMARHPNSKSTDTLRDSVADQVVDIVVRDIWSRSRLREDVLEQVWLLVDTQHNGRLFKEEFVVGLWLIDQCLKGRKLPTKVTDSVWNSVKFLQGIKVRNK